MAPDRTHRQFPIILALGTTQTLAWASSYYLPAILADPIGRDLGMSANWIFAAFSAALVISALLGPRIGRQMAGLSHVVSQSYPVDCLYEGPTQQFRPMNRQVLQADG